RAAHLDRAVADGVQHLQARNDFASGEDLNLEPVVGDFGDMLSEVFAAAVKRIERLRPACRQPPFYFRRRLRNRGCSDGYCCGSQTGSLQELTTFHGVSPR